MFRTAIKLEFIIFLLITVFCLQSAISLMREEANFNSGGFIFKTGDYTSFLVLAGARGLASDLIWLKIDNLWHHGRWYDILPLLRMIVYLEPDFITAWSLGGWHQAYNLSYYAEGTELEKRYIDAGLGFLKKGLALNRDTYELYFEIGWTYFHRLKDYDNALYYFEEAAKYDHPSYIDRLIIRCQSLKGEK